jgi:hypothetical protein
MLDGKDLLEKELADCGFDNFSIMNLLAAV